jgi:CheY-like chemotaxis protein
MQALIDKPDLTLVVEEPPAQTTIRTDEMLLSQILRNLLTNAIKFTERGEVRLVARISEDARRLDLIVSDTGLGIAPTDQERVFEEFYQVRTGGPAPIRGTGLGLSYARRVAGLLGGSLTLISTPGEGSTFTVSLPFGPAAVEAEGREPRLILVVEDDATFRTAVVATLRDPWTRVVEARDGREAIAAIDAERPDLVVLDMRLPEVHGEAVLDHLSTEALRRIPVIVLTAFTPDVASSSALPRVSAILGKAANSLDDLPTLVRVALRGASR